MHKSIWYIHPYSGAPSIGRAYRPYYFAKEFVKKGHDVYIISASFHHLLSSPERFCINTKSELKYIDGLKYFLIKTPKYKGNGIKRLLNMFVFSMRLLTLYKLPKSVERPDAIIASSPHLFHMLSAYLLAKKHKAKFIVEIRDIWPLSLLEITKTSKFNPIIWLLKILEIFAYNKADKIVGLLPGMKDYFKKEIFKQKCCYIPNGALYTKESFVKDSNSKIMKEVAGFKNKGDFILFYGGGLGPPNAMQLLIEAMHYTQKENANIRAIIIGDGVLKNDLIKRSLSLGLTNINFYPMQEQNVFQNVLSICDVAYISWCDLSMYKQYGVSANKLYEYMNFGKPILQSGDLGYDAIKSSGCGLSVATSDPKILASEIIKMSDMKKEELEAMGNKGNIYIKNNHSFKLLAGRYIDCMFNR